MPSGGVGFVAAPTHTAVDNLIVRMLNKWPVMLAIAASEQKCLNDAAGSQLPSQRHVLLRRCKSKYQALEASAPGSRMLVKLITRMEDLVQISYLTGDSWVGLIHMLTHLLTPGVLCQSTAWSAPRQTY